MSLKDLPSPSAPNFLPRVREMLHTLAGKTGSARDRALTLADAIESGVIGVGPGGSLVPGPEAGETYVPDLTPPPTPDTLTATPAISHILLEVPAATYTQGHGHLRTRVYGATRLSGDPAPVFADAVEVGQFSGTVWAFPSNPSTTWHFWAKWESVDGVLSATPVGGTNGVSATTGQDVSHLVLAMTGPGNPFKVVTSETTLPDGSVVPPGTYTSDAYVHNGQITNAKIANLAVDDAKIANLSVSKLTAGSIAVGQYIQSTGVHTDGTPSWRIDGNGNATFNNAIVRGTVYATDGTFTGSVTGSTINGSWMNSGAINLYGDGSGGWGYARSAGKWWDDGNNGWVFAHSGLDGRVLAEIKGGNQRIWMSSWGDCGIQFPGITMTNGGLTINQANVINTLNIAGGSVTSVSLGKWNGNLSISHGNFADFANVWLDVGDNPSGVSIIVGTLSYGNTGPLGPTFRVYRNGGLVFQEGSGGFAYPTTHTMFGFDYPPPGVHLYTLQVGHLDQWTSRNLIVLTASILLQGAKR